MNSGTFALGPGNHANSTIGRALNLFMTNLGGGQIGINRMGTQGNVSGYAFCFAENEEASPWESFAVERGFGSEESVLTLFGGGWFHAGNYISQPLEDMAKAMAAVEFPMGMVALLAPARAKMLHQQQRDKTAVKDSLWRSATSTVEEFKSKPWYKVFIEPLLEGKGPQGDMDLFPKEYLHLPDDEVIPVFPRKLIDVIVVGGEVNPMMQGWLMSRPVSASIDRWR
jgi:hypothetical protein